MSRKNSLIVLSWWWKHTGPHRTHHTDRIYFEGCSHRSPFPDKDWVSVLAGWHRTDQISDDVRSPSSGSDVDIHVMTSTCPQRSGGSGHTVRQIRSARPHSSDSVPSCESSSALLMTVAYDVGMWAHSHVNSVTNRKMLSVQFVRCVQCEHVCSYLYST